MEKVVGEILETIQYINEKREKVSDWQGDHLSTFALKLVTLNALLGVELADIKTEILGRKARIKFKEADEYISQRKKNISVKDAEAYAKMSISSETIELVELQGQYEKANNLHSDASQQVTALQSRLKVKVNEEIQHNQ